jgi:hypothetical protein
MHKNEEGPRTENRIWEIQERKNINPREEIHNDALVGITRKVYDKQTEGKNRKQCHSRNKGTKPQQL